jgi:hypothetical protein
MITEKGNSTAALFWIKYGNITALESDLQSGLNKIFNIMNGTYPSKEFIVMAVFHHHKWLKDRDIYTGMKRF